MVPACKGVIVDKASWEKSKNTRYTQQSSFSFVLLFRSDFTVAVNRFLCHIITDGVFSNTQVLDRKDGKLNREAKKKRDGNCSVF